jgi:negative modulator of initiation of replication
MKNIEVDDQLYQYIAKNTQYIGESASDILRRLLAFDLDKNQTDMACTESSSEPLISSVEQPKTSDHQQVFNYLNKEELAMQRGAVGRFLLILSALYRANKQNFHQVLAIRGRDRLYFADSEAALAESGSSTKPKQIPATEFWVMTNSNTTRKKMMLTEAAIALGYSAEQAEQIRELLK